MVVFIPGDAHGKGVRWLWPARAERRNATGGADQALKGEACLLDPNCDWGWVGGGDHLRVDYRPRSALPRSRWVRLELPSDLSLVTTWHPAGGQPLEDLDCCCRRAWEPCPVWRHGGRMGGLRTRLSGVPRKGVRALAAMNLTCSLGGGGGHSS